MEVSDVPTPEVPAADAAPAAEPVAPEAPPAAEPAVEAPVSGPEAPAEDAAPATPEELQAEIDALRAEIETKQQDAVEPAPAPEPVPVLSRQPSSASPTQAPEAADEKVFEFVDALRVVVTLVRAHRTIGDTDLAEAIDVLAAVLPPLPEPVAEAESGEQA